jgi:hypothetical protein
MRSLRRRNGRQIHDVQGADVCGAGVVVAGSFAARRARSLMIS